MGRRESALGLGKQVTGELTDQGRCRRRFWGPKREGGLAGDKQSILEFWLRRRVVILCLAFTFCWCYALPPNSKLFMPQAERRSIGRLSWQNNNKAIPEGQQPIRNNPSICFAPNYTMSLLGNHMEQIALSSSAIADLPYNFVPC